MNYQELHSSYQSQMAENEAMREEYMQEREQLEKMVNSMQEKYQNLYAHIESKDHRIQELEGIISTLKYKEQEDIQNLENQKIKAVKAEYDNKLRQQSVEIDKLREYIRKRSQEDTQTRNEERLRHEEERQKSLKEQKEVKEQFEKKLRNRENEIQALKEKLRGYDPQDATSHGDEYTCPDCLSKESQIKDKEKRIDDLTEYIRKSNERVAAEKKKWEEEVQRLKRTQSAAPA